MIKKAPQKSPTSPQSRRSRAPVCSAVSAISVSPQAPAAADTCANQPPAASPLPPNNSKSSRRRAPAGQTTPPAAPTTPAEQTTPDASIATFKPTSRQARPKRACPTGQNLTATPELPSAPLKTFSQQTRLARVCPCPAGQTTPTTTAPLTPSSLSLNRTTPNQPTAKCGSSAFAPTGLFPRICRKIKCLFSYPAPTTTAPLTPSSLSLNRTTPNQPAAKCGSSAFAPSGLFPRIRHKIKCLFSYPAPATPTAPTHHGKPLYAGVADTGAATARGAPTTPPAPTSPAGQTTTTAAPTSPTLSAFDLALWLKQRARKADPLFWLAFAVAFAALNLIFLFHGAHFLFGDHDWKYLKPGLSLGAGLFEGRFAQFLPINILSGGDILPIVNNILGFAGFSLGVALLARYWRLPRQKSAWLLFALFTAVTPYILSFMYFAFLIIPVLGWSAFVLGSLLISEKETRFSPIRSLSAIALATLALGGYPPVVNLMAVALAVRLLFAALFESESARGLWRRYRWTAINLLLAAICCKLCLWGLGKIGAMNTAYYNLQTTPLAEWGNKFLLVSRDLWQQFTVTLPFIDTPYKTAAGLVAACGVASFTRLLIAPKSDYTPGQSADHQTRPTYSPSQPDSSPLTNQPPSATPGACPARATAPTKSDYTLGQSADHQARPSYSPSQPDSSHLTNQPPSATPGACPAGQNISTPPELPLTPLKTFSQQTRLARVCPAGQPTPTAVTPLSPSSLSLNPTSPDQPADKCGSSAFAPTEQHPAPYTTRTTTPANRISQTALLLLLFAAVLYAPLLTLFISTSLAETEFSPRIDFFGLMYFYAAMFALTLKAAAPATPVLTSEPSPKKSDCTPDQSADHQTHPFYPFSQSVSSSQPSIHQATPAVACPAGQPTPTAVTPLSPSSLSLNPTSPDQPADKCGSSAFAPTEQSQPPSHPYRRRSKTSPPPPRLPPSPFLPTIYLTRKRCGNWALTPK